MNPGFLLLPLETAMLPKETGWNGFRVARRLWALDLPLIFCSLAALVKLFWAVLSDEQMSNG